MKKYSCIKDCTVNGVSFSSVGDIVALMPDNSTVVNVTKNQKVLINSAEILKDSKSFVPLWNREDKVNHPKHYTSHPSGVECIDITRHYCFSIGNAIKYLWRAGLKQEVGYKDKQKEIEDLKKAIWYINDRINQLQR